MKKKTIQLIIIIALICCMFTLLGCGLWLNRPNAPKENDSNSSSESTLTPGTPEGDEKDWTNNY